MAFGEIVAYAVKLMMRFKNVDPLFHTPSKTNPLGLVRHFIGGVSVDTRYIQIFTSFLRLTMTVRTESAQLTIESPKTNCGRCSCIILYSSENCILCDAALEILYSVISDFGLPHSVIRKVDVINDEDDCDLPPPVALPAIRICQDVILGLPDMDTARGAVMHAVLNGCFSDCQ